MEWGFEAWLVTDCYDQAWRFWLMPPGDSLRGEGSSSVSDAQLAELWPGGPLSHIIFNAFDDLGALCDDPARDLIAIYDTLTGAELGERLPHPTKDPRRLLRGFEQELRRVLFEATEAGILRFERHDVPWPFPEVDRKPNERPQDHAAGDTFVAFRLVDQDGEPFGRCAYRLTLPDKSVVEGTVKASGRVLHDGITAGTCDLEFPMLDARDFSPSSRTPGKRSDLDKGPVVPKKDEKGEQGKDEQAKDDPSKKKGKTHKVRHGDTLASLGVAHGFVNDHTIWNAGENADLRARRAHAQALLAGDIVALPEQKPRKVSIPTGAEEKITVYLSRAELRVRQVDGAGAPLAGQDCAVKADGAQQDLTTDGDGVLRAKLLSASQWVEVVENEEGIRLEVGALPPINESAGAKARLHNLGYLPTLPFAPVFEGDAVEDQDASEASSVIGSNDYQLAVELFQDLNQLKIQNEMAPEWVDKLEELSGAKPKK